MDAEQQRRTTKNGILRDIEDAIDDMQSGRSTGEIIPKISIKDGGVQGFKMNVEKQKRIK